MHLLDALGQPMRSWDDRDQGFSITYDDPRRPVDRTVSLGRVLTAISPDGSAVH